METHISWVLLTGRFAYKIKKAVDFGFLDFSTLEKRHFYCNEELRLNRRFASGIYLDVVGVTGSQEKPVVNGPGEALEYAVRMRQFPQAGLLSRIADNGRFVAGQADEIVALVADMHTHADRSGPDSEFGMPEDIQHWVMENFSHIRRSLSDSLQLRQLDELDIWCQETFTECRDLLESRRHEGYVRECHGDLHLGNLAVVDQRITPFDCIEFNPHLRWIDVMSEAAFLMMDIQERGYPALACHFLNGYLQYTGDYTGVRLLNYYLVYRALVRAKVAVLRAGQSDLDVAGQTAAREEFAAYLALAVQYATPRPRAMIITHGVSGSGKSWWSKRLSEQLGAIWMRSDVERKRLFGYRPDADTASGINTGIYTADATVRTYSVLARIAQEVIEAGYPVLVDATFLKRAERDRFRSLAGMLGVPCIVLHCEASAAVLNDRLRKRQADDSDASEAGMQVLESQLATQEPLQPDEFDTCTVISTQGFSSGNDLAARVGELLESS
ncbi:MAG: AAA family ATPase [Gammaproteobacteria bacterium]|nr:MAG: AAA family ATPase [Gammaproteobacteria bacterium]